MLVGQAGRYEITEEVGRGPAGRVLLARDSVSGRQVVLEVLDALAGVDAASRQAATEVLQKTQDLLERLANPDLAVVLDLAELDGRPVVVAEHVDGNPLSSFRDRAELLPLDAAVEIGARAAEALSQAHGVGLVHGGIKPSNLFRVGEAGVKITSFGVALALHAAGVGEDALDHGAGYLPPERLRGGVVAATGDLFSLAAVLYEVFGGEPAFPGDSSSSVVYRIVHEPPRDPARLSRPLPAALSAPLLQALSKRPDDRLASGKVLAESLRNAAREGHAVAAQPTSPSPFAERRGPSNPPPAAPDGPPRGRKAARPASRGGPGIWILGVSVLIAAGAGIWLARDRFWGAAPAREVWWEARVRSEPPEAELALDGIPLDPQTGGLVRFRPEGPFGTLTASLGCRSVERQLRPADAGGEIVLVVDPVELDWTFDPGVAGARIELDGRPAGSAPVDLLLDLCREHRIEVVADAYQPATVELPAGATPSEARSLLYALSLERIPIGRLVLPEATGVELVWYVDGRRLGASERELQLEQGTHKVRYKNEYHFIDATIPVTVIGGEAISPDLRELSLGELTVQAFPSNCKVYLRRPGGSWRYVDETPASRKVATGRYEVKVELKPTGQAAVREIDLGPGENPPVRVAFGGRG